MTFEANNTILIVDDNPTRRVRLADAMTRQGCFVQAAACFRDASKITSRDTPDVILINSDVLGAPETFVKRVKTEAPTTAIYIVTAEPSSLPTRYEEVHILPADTEEKDLVQLLCSK